MSNNSLESVATKAPIQSADKKNVESEEKRKKTAAEAVTSDLAKEINGPKGLEPTRYGDWESKGRCYDF